MVACVHKDRLRFAQMRYAETTLPTRFGEFRILVYRLQDGYEHVALVKGDIENKSGVLVRMQSECLTGEVFGSLKCDCKSQLDLAMSQIQTQKAGIVLYLRQEGRGIGLGNKIRAYQLQKEGLDTVDANRILGFPDDVRDFSCAVRILRDLNVASVRLMTNNPQKVEALVNSGIHVVERIPLIVEAHEAAKKYLQVKGDRMGHFIDSKNRQQESFHPVLLDSRF